MQRGIDGVNVLPAQTLIGECGPDMSSWETEGRFVSWLSLAPNNKISGGKIIGRDRRKVASRASQALRNAAGTLLRSQSSDCISPAQDSDSISRMRYFAAALTALCSAFAVILIAQTAPPNAAGISMGHIHLVVPDPAAMQKVWVDVMGGKPSTAGPLTLVKLPNVFVIITGGASAAGREGTDGSAVNHVGFSVKSYAATRAKAEAAGLAVRELTPGQQAFVTFPNNVTVEIQEDTSIAGESEFSHFHLSVPDPNAAREWYIKTFGGEEGQRRKGLKGAKIPGGFVDFLGPAGAGRGKAKEGAPPPPPPAASKGRVLDHIGFEVKDLKSFTDHLAADGIKLDVPLTDATSKMGLKIAFITDPYGTYIELTEGLNAK
ncbi:MAG: VOC family protein [Bryobacterales bacterium]|nr:VOC family protein [Bryobacterales bacterium]MBV9401968.1 VOC family protein [Bryobacterales bacterium]